ncbi:MAG TPA: alpha/beta hydrolase family protein [Blastocatellia bacterium]
MKTIKRVAVAALTALSVIVVCLTACGKPSADTAQVRPVDQSSPSASQTPASGGNVQYASFHSDALGTDLAYAIQLPPSYNQQTTRRYPVLYFLHGMFGNEREFERRGVAAEIDKLRASGVIGDFIIVSPAGKNSFYLNSKAGVRYEDAIVADLIPYIEKTYRTIGTPAGRAIQGISMGGFGALVIAFKHPEMFSSVTTHCAALFTTLPVATGDDQRSQFIRRLLGNIFGDPPDEAFYQTNNPIKLGVSNAAAIKKSGLKIYFDCGEQDRYGFQETNKVLDQQLTQAGVAHEFHIFPGGHGWEYMISVADHSYGFLWKNFTAGKSAAAGM